MDSEDTFVEETEMLEFEEDSQIMEFDDSTRFTVSPNLVAGGGGTGSEIVGFSNDYTDILDEISGKLDTLNGNLETLVDLDTSQFDCVNRIVMRFDILLVGVGLLLGLIMGKLMWGRVRV